MLAVENCKTYFYGKLKTLITIIVDLINYHLFFIGINKFKFKKKGMFL